MAFSSSVLREAETPVLRACPGAGVLCRPCWGCEGHHGAPTPGLAPRDGRTLADGRFRGGRPATAGLRLGGQTGLRAGRFPGISWMCCCHFFPPESRSGALRRFTWRARHPVSVVSAADRSGAGQAGPETSRWLPPPPGEEGGWGTERFASCRLGSAPPSMGWSWRARSAARCGDQEPSRAGFGDVGGPITPAPPTPVPGGITREP